MIGDNELNKVVRWKEEIDKREGIIATLDNKKLDEIIIGFQYTFAGKRNFAKFHYGESEDIIKKTIRFYKIQQYLRIVELSREIKKILPSYTITNPTILKAIKEENELRKEIEETLGPIGQILSGYV